MTEAIVRAQFRRDDKTAGNVRGTAGRPPRPRPPLRPPARPGCPGSIREVLQDTHLRCPRARARPRPVGGPARGSRAGSPASFPFQALRGRGREQTGAERSRD